MILVTVKGKFAPVGGREYLLAGSLLMTLSNLLGLFSPIAFGLGLVVYLIGLYLWSVDVDSRPLKLFLLEAALFLVAVFLLSLALEWVLLKPSWGIYKLINLLAPAYPAFVASALVYRLRMGLFAESTGELNFNLVGNLYLVGALLFPVLIGVVLMSIARLVEAYSYWNLPLAARKDVPFNFSKRKVLAVFVASLILSPVLFNVPFPNYDGSARSNGVAVYWSTSGSPAVVDVLIKVPGNFCGAGVYVDGIKVGQKYESMTFWGPLQSILALSGDEVIRYHIELFKSPENVTVMVCVRDVKYVHTLEGYAQEWVEDWKNMPFQLSGEK
ncbi:DUF996 domain-containing protein [Thermococcus eurythermalis]|uniref:DUF996 domain-containing protein n=1 Tax=Thermococcus eurythermalis TaxID=1505907 RepID=UPI00118662B6|nr:DUF996 domain-containing protein [Thermococcus eurythermalis]